MITGLSACQRSVEQLLEAVKSSNERISEMAEKVNNLDDKVAKIASDRAEEEKRSSDGHGKKRKRNKSSLLIQEEVHKLHNSRDAAKQYRGRETISSTHNIRVTQFIVGELSRQPGFLRTAIEKSAKKYHEHIRRTALGKITDEMKEKKKKILRKERKFTRRKSNVKDEKELRAFGILTKEHMSSDDDNSDAGGWVSRPPRYRSETLTTFLNRLDKRAQKGEKSQTKRWKRTMTTKGAPVDKEPPTGTPKWALSNEWKEIMSRREEQVERENADGEYEEDALEHNRDEGNMEDAVGDEDEQSSQSDLDFEE